MLETWKVTPYYLACNSEVVWISPKPITADNPDNDPAKIWVVALPTGANPRDVGDRLVQLLVMQRQRRCDVI